MVKGVDSEHTLLFFGANINLGHCQSLLVAEGGIYYMGEVLLLRGSCSVQYVPLWDRKD